MVLRPVKIVAALLVLLGFAGAPAAAQSGATSTTMTVSVRVLQPCALSTPSQLPDVAAPAPLDIRCDRRISSIASATGLVSVKGASAPTAVRTEREGGQVTLSVDF